jgi:opacity protein-like surface antigen
MAGAGIEYMINCHWSAKLEYQHAFYGADAIDGTNVEEEFGSTSSGPSIEKETYDIEKPQNSVRVGLNYKF